MSGCIWCMCVCLNRHGTLETSYILGNGDSSYFQMYIQKRSLQNTVCRPPYLLLESQDVIHVLEQSTVWPLLRATVLFPAAPPCNTMMQMEKKVIWWRKQIWQIISVLFLFFFCQMEPSMPLHTNYLCEWLAVRLKEEAPGPFGGIKIKPYGGPLSLLSHIMRRIYYFFG